MSAERTNRRKTGRSARAYWLSGLIVSFATLVVCFVILEISFRVLESQSAPEGELWAVYDPDLGYRPNPKYRDINAHGMRDIPVSPPDGRFRVLILGDSVAYYGDNTHDTFVGHLRARIAQEAELVETVVFNAGVRGYTNYQELVWLRKYGLALELDLVGIAFVFKNLHRFLHAFRIKDEKIVSQSYDFTTEAVSTVKSPLYQFARKSRFLVWLRRRLADAVSTVESSKLVSEAAFTFDLRPDFNTAWRDKSWDAIEAQLREMQDLRREHGFGLFVVAFPFGQQYRQDYLRRNQTYVMKPQRMLRRIIEELEIPLLDLYLLLNADVDLKDDDIHLTGPGRRKVGDLLASFLKSERLVPMAAQ